MKKKPESPSLRDYEEEAVPFDDAMRQLLAAKPQPKQADKQKFKNKPKKEK